MRNCRSKKYRRGHLSTQCATSATPMNVPPPVDVIPLRAENQRDDSENVNSFRGGSTFSTWLYRVAVNTVLMKLRRKSPPVLSLDEPVSRDSPSLKREVEKEDLKLRGAIDRIVLRRAIEELPGGCRQIFDLHEVEGYAHREIAELLHCSIGNSKSQLHKAKMKMRELLPPQRRILR